MIKDFVCALIMPSKNKKSLKKKVKAAVAKAIATPTKGKKKNSGRRARRARARASGVSVAYNASNFMKPMSQRSSSDGHMCRFKGTDFLTAVTIGASNAAAGDVLYTTVVNPKTLGISRLATVAQLWERYKFKRLRFRYAPVCPSTTAGQLIGYVDYDTYDDPTGISGVQNLQRAAAHYGEKPVQVWQGEEKPVSWDIKDIDPLTDLYVDSDGTDPRWTNQGRFVLLAASAVAANTACGNIYLDYDIEFYIPQLEMTPSNGFGFSIVGGGSFSTSAMLGSTPAGATWNNIPYSLSGNVISLQAGSYLVWDLIQGTTIAAHGFTSTGTIGYGPLGVINAAANASTVFGLVYSSVPFTITLSSTAASVTAGRVYVGLLPTTALTLKQRRVDQISRMLKLCGEVESLKASIATAVEIESEGKEAKQEIVQVSVPASSASTSSVTSVIVGSQMSASVSPNEDYYMVPKRCSTSKPKS